MLREIFRVTEASHRDLAMLNVIVQALDEEGFGAGVDIFLRNFQGGKFLNEASKNRVDHGGRSAAHVYGQGQARALEKLDSGQRPDAPASSRDRGDDDKADSRRTEAHRNEPIARGGDALPPRRGDG